MLNDAAERLSQPTAPAQAVEWHPATTPAVEAPVPETQAPPSQQETREIGVPSLETHVNVVIQQPKQQPRRGIHYVHLLLTVVTGGGWLPIWVMYGVGVYFFSRLKTRGWAWKDAGTTVKPESLPGNSKRGNVRV